MIGRDRVHAAAGIGALAIAVALVVGGITTKQPVRGKSSNKGALDHKSALAARAKLPITFVENRGQTAQQVRYFAHGPNYAFFFERDEVLLAFTSPSRQADFPTTPNAVDRVFKGQTDIFWGDAFITKLALNGSPPPPPPLPTVASVTPAAIELLGSNSVALTVALTSGAQGTGAVVSLTSSNPTVLSVPATLAIPAGAQSGTVTATTSIVPANTPVLVTASYNNSSLGTTITLLPVPPPAALNSIGFFPNTVTGGTAALAILSVTSPVGSGGFTASLSANVQGIITLPATITVPPGQTNIGFSVPTVAVTTQTGLTVFATAGGRTELAPLFVNPATPPPPPTVTLTVNASGRTGQRVTSSPAGINVAVGSSMQAPFTSGTSVTLAVSNGRTALWSGACSNGSKTQNACTFTLNGSATVNANVQ
ncbi:MAG: hypothetical protein QOH67_4348 [Hyphomicrobiales bacterium]|nr:hypothetical protein [Hyphomicrobiales bacterium]